MTPSINSKPRTALDEMDGDGRFVRKEAAFRGGAIVPGGRFEPEAGRYHLYVALGCPWAAGTLAALKYKGLGGVIGHSIAHPTWLPTRPEDPDDGHCGWHFRAPGDDPVTNSLGHGSFECDGALVPDDVNGARTVRELYDMAGDVEGKYSTPVLWDKKEKTIVSNESLDIIKMFDGSFDGLAERPDRRLFPSGEEGKELDALNEWIYPTVNNGVYRTGFAKTQSAYSEAHAQLFESLARLEERFEANAASGVPFLVGRSLTWLDLRLYETLVRFDPVYVVYFKASHRRVADHPRILDFVRRCHAIPEVRAATNMRHIKMHYFSSHPTLNPYGVIPESDGPPLE